MKNIIVFSIAICAAIAVKAQNISLPAPDLKTQSLSTVEALAQRRSIREYSSEKLSQQELSNLLWATFGVSRDKDHRTAPTAMNRKEIRVYLFNDEAVYEYLPVDNVLQFVADGDYRDIVAGRQAFAAKAPVSILLVGDMELFGADNDHARLLVAMDAGIAAENIYLFAAATGLATVTRATMDIPAIQQVLNLNEKQIPLLNNPVGRPQ